MRKLRIICLIGLTLLPPFLQQGALALSGDLGQWLRAEAGPEIVSLLKREPRFIGEPIEVIAIRNGSPVTVPEALTATLVEEFRHLLINEAGVRVPITEYSHCQLSKTNIALGINISRADRHRHRVQIALLDLDEDLWINGSSLVWQGRLTSDQSRRLATRLPNTTDVPTNPGNHHNEDSLARADGEQPHCQQASPQSISRPAPEPALLSAISMSTRKTECRGHGRDCIDIEYETFDDAFVFEFFTRSGELVVLDCRNDLALSYGTTRRGLRVPKTGHRQRPSLGYYVLATRNSVVANQLGEILHAASGACGGHAGKQSREELARLVRHPDVSWQGLHLTHQRGRVTSLRNAS